MGRRSLIAAVTSALGQSRLPDEVVVGVDSKFQLPTTVASVIEALCASCRVELTVVQDAGSGVAAVRNRCIDEANSATIALLDDDDLWTPDHLARATNELQKGSVDVYSACAALIIDDKVTRQQPPPNHTYRDTGPLSRWFYEEIVTARFKSKGIPTPTIVLAADRARSVRMNSQLHAMEDFAWLMDLQAEGARLRQWPTIDVIVARNSTRGRFRVSPQQVEMFAEHLERNSRGMGGRYLVGHAALSQVKRRDWVGAIQDCEVAKRYPLRMSDRVISLGIRSVSRMKG